MMKKHLTIIPILLFTLIYSSTSYAEWTKLGENTVGDTYYIDFDRIRKVDGYVYYWILSDYLKPLLDKYLSSKSYRQGDCKLFMFKDLSWSFYKEPMGKGTGYTEPPLDKWNYPPPNSTMENILNIVCAK